MPAVLKELATYASGIGAHTSPVVGPVTVRHDGVVDAAHAEGLLVHAWTVRDENRFLEEAYRVGDAPDARGSSAGLTHALLDAGVDGHRHDRPDTAVEARGRWLARRETRAPATVG